MNAQYYTIAEVAFCLHVSTRTVRRMVASGELPASKVGGSVRVDPADLSSYLNTAKIEPSKKQARRRWKGIEVTPQKLAARAYFNEQYRAARKSATK